MKHLNESYELVKKYLREQNISSSTEILLLFNYFIRFFPFYNKI